MEYPIVNEALTTRLQTHPEIRPIVATQNPREFLAQAETRALDVAVMGLQDPVKGVRLVHELGRATTKTRSILVVDAWCDVVAYAAYRCGVSSVLGQPESVETLIQHIEDVASGRVVQNQKALQEIERSLDSTGLLALMSFNSTDTSILSYLCDGMTDKEIAQRVYLSAQTIRNRVSAMLHKTGKTNRTQLALSFAPIKGLFGGTDSSDILGTECNCLMQHAQVVGYR
jgi:DNA-binding NarL/FixJ family response regulator